MPYPGPPAPRGRPVTAPSPLPDHGHGWVWRELWKRVGGVVVEREIDIIPVGDKMVHLYPGSECWCRATPDLTDIMPVYTHHSLDGRELTEHGRTRE